MKLEIYLMFLKDLNLLLKMLLILVIALLNF